MEYREIVAVTGLGGLYQLLTTKSDGAIVRNVADKSTRFISARQHNVTPLDSIEVYTTGDNVRLQNVFQKMLEHEATVPLADAKTTDNTAIKGYFKSIFPEFDDERVYVSDMKKMLRWYELLKANDLLKFEEDKTEAHPDASSEAIGSESGAVGATAESVAVADAGSDHAETEVAPVNDAVAENQEAGALEGEEKPSRENETKE